MRLKKYRRAAAFLLSFMLMVSGIQMGSVNVSAAGEVAAITLTGFGNTIRSGADQMFNDGVDNTWLFGGGVETQGRFAEVGGVRNYVGQFEEYIRWVRASGSYDNYRHRQRYMTNVGKEGVDAAGFAGKLTQYIKDLDPKAVAYLIGPEDYTKGETGIAGFKTALKSIIDKSLAARSNKGFAVIQLPHAAKDTDAANVTLYAQAAAAVLNEYTDAAVKGRIVPVDHYTSTSTDAAFKTGKLTSDGYLNAQGHYQIAKELAQATLNDLTGFPTITDWTQKAAPEQYLTLRPATLADGKGNLAVSIQDDASIADITQWEYTVSIDDMEITGTAGVLSGRVLAISGLPIGKEYCLTLTSADGKIRLASVYGMTAEGNQGGAKKLNSLQAALKAKVDDKTKPLTWLFMGDSITHGAAHTHGYDSIAQTFEKYIKEDLGRTDDIVVNTAVSGATLGTRSDGNSTLTNLADRLNRYKPDIVSVMLGTNDTDTAGYQDNLKTLVTEIRKNNADARIIFRTPTPSGTSNSDGKAVFASGMKAVAAEDGNIICIDQYTDWRKEIDVFSYMMNKNFYYGDGSLHPGAAGQLRMAQQFIRECGMDTDTRIANLAYNFNGTYAKETNANQLAVAKGKDKISINKSEWDKLSMPNGTIVTVTLTDAASGGRTYTKKVTLPVTEDVIIDNMANQGGKTYSISVKGIAAGSTAKETTITANPASVTLSGQNAELPFNVVLSNTNAGEWDAGSTVGILSVGKSASAGEYSYQFVTKTGDSNDKFEIAGSVLKVKTALEHPNTYNICIKAVKKDDAQAVSQETEFTIRTVRTLAAVRADARASFAGDKKAFDLDVSEKTFNGTAGQYVNDNAYLEVLNKLRTSSTGGTIIYRFKTTQQNGVIFSSGDSGTSQSKNIMCFGVGTGYMRTAWRANYSMSIRNNYTGAKKLDDGKWHTVAMSFDTNADVQHQALLSIDGGDNIVTSVLQNASYKSWFSINPDSEITHFAIGSSNYSGDTQGFAMSTFNGNISFVTVTDDVYTEEDLKALSQTNFISGSQALMIDKGSKTVVVPAGAPYTASALTLAEDEMSASFTLTAKGGGNLFDDSISIQVNGMTTYGEPQITSAANKESITVTVQIFDRAEAKQAMQTLVDKYSAKYNEILAGGTGYDAAKADAFKTAYEKVKQAAEAEKSLLYFEEFRAELEEAVEALGTGSGSDPVEDDKENPQIEAAVRTLTELLNGYDVIVGRDEALYTAESWKAFKDAIAQARNFLNDANAQKTAEILAAKKTDFENISKVLVKKNIENSDKTQTETPVKLKAPEILSAAVVAEKDAVGIKITVGTVENAASYTVYRANGEKVADADAAGIVYDTNLPGGKTVSYYAVANAGSAKFLASDKGAEKSVSLSAAVKGLKVKAKGKSQMSISFKKSKDAKQYLIYRSTNKDSGFVRVAASKKTSFTDKKLKKKQSYYYMVIIKTKTGYSGAAVSKAVKAK